jgi:hypothetical protein
MYSAMHSLKYYVVRPPAELKIAHSNTPENGVLLFLHWGINLYYQDRADFYLTRNEGKPVLSLEELVLVGVHRRSQQARFSDPRPDALALAALGLWSNYRPQLPDQRRRQRFGARPPSSCHSRGVAPDG